MVSPPKEEYSGSPGAGGAELSGVSVWTPAGNSLRSHGSVPAESAAVVLCVHHGDSGRPGGVRYGAVNRCSGQRHGDAALHVLR